MYCMKCNHDLSECTCPDIKERLAAISNHPNIAVKWCRKCDNHYAQCRCPEPEFYIKTGKEK